MTHHKLTLPTRICAARRWPFAWRKKWARDWEHVRYRSERCCKAGAAPDPES